MLHTSDFVMPFLLSIVSMFLLLWFPKPGLSILSCNFKVPDVVLSGEIEAFILTALNHSPQKFMLRIDGFHYFGNLNCIPFVCVTHEVQGVLTRV